MNMADKIDYFHEYASAGVYQQLVIKVYCVKITEVANIKVFVKTFGTVDTGSIC